MVNVKAFIPGKKFPDISITGTSCPLNCAYCEAYYLHGMEPAPTPKKLYDTVRYLVKRGAKGVLISGGFDLQGKLPIEPFLPTIKDIKRDFDIVVSIHQGLVDKDLALKLREAEILEEFGPYFIAPHIPLGFNYGRILHEYKVIDILTDFDPYILVFLVFIPTKGTRMSDSPIPDPKDVIKIISYARRKFKKTLALGCMRPWKIKYLVDPYLIEKSIVDRITNPPKSIIKKYNLKVIEACCSVPKELLHKFI
ncbi:MAG: radical SAM protein [Desulfurococcales archaeon ex4484_217_2]|nr:MAG: radical SAM protein [Desulfurococcales archaeon ex4484_217_2]